MTINALKTKHAQKTTQVQNSSRTQKTNQAQSSPDIFKTKPEADKKSNQVNKTDISKLLKASSLSDNDNDILNELRNASEKADKTNGLQDSKNDFMEIINKWNCDTKDKFYSALHKNVDDGKTLHESIKGALVGAEPDKVKSSVKAENDDGTVTENIEYEDGTKSIKVTSPDGTYIEKGTNTDGEEWTKTTNPDGSYTKIRKMPDGSKCEIHVYRNGDISAETTSPNGFTCKQTLEGNVYTESGKIDDGSEYELVVNTITGMWVRDCKTAVGKLDGGTLYQFDEYFGKDFGGKNEYKNNLDSLLE